VIDANHKLPYNKTHDRAGFGCLFAVKNEFDLRRIIILTGFWQAGKTILGGYCLSFYEGILLKIPWSGAFMQS
jgi:hypothetical protein